MDGTDKVESANFIVSLWKRFTRGSVNRNILGALLTVGGIMFLVKLISMVKDMVLAYSFGTGDAIDAFIIAFIIPNFIISILGSTFRAAVIPTFIEERENKGPEAAQQVLSGIVVLALVFLIALTLLMTLFCDPILKFLGSGFSKEKLDLCREIYFGLLPIIFLSCFSRIFSAVLNADKRFGIASACDVFIPTIIILFVLCFADSWGIHALVWGTVVGFFVNWLTLFIVLKSKKLSLKPRWTGFTPPIKQIIHQYVPLMMGYFIILSAEMIDKAMASMLPAGSVASLNYGIKIPSVVMGICSAGLGTAVLPYFSQMVAEKNWLGMGHTLRKYFWMIIKLSIPLALLLILCSELMTKILFQRGAFSESDSQIVSSIQSMYFIQLPFHLIKVLGIPILNSLKQNQALMKNAAFHTVINIGLNFVFMGPLGVKGLALATSVAQILSCVVIYWYINKIEHLNLKKMLFKN